ncbi:MAG: DMT family transporter [Candidatus Krumholzibacteriota bacterium]|nr:DMT family transporter [Candidatus Krumholzibacteriota bacterium]
MIRKNEYFALTVGLVSISFAAIFIKLAQAPAPVVSALRMIFSTLLIIPYAMCSKNFRREIASLSINDAALLVFSGILLAAHFLSWITSLSLTGITSSIVFVTTSPLFVALYTVIFFREKVSGSFWAGLVIAATGILIMAGGNMLAGGENWKGDLLAVAGAVSAAGYFLVGSRLRSRLSLITYIMPVYLISAVILTAAVPVCGERLTGHPARSYLYCLLMAAVCQLAGHTVFNWALKRVKAAVVTLSILGEPVGTTLLAFLILDKTPAAAEMAGGVFVLAGIFTAIYCNPGVTVARRAKQVRS